MIETVVVATDGSASVQRAVVAGVDLADRFSAEVHALYVLDPHEVDVAPDALQDDIRAALTARGDEALDEVAQVAGGSVVTALREGRPANEISAYAREVDADVVAIGTRGRHGEHRLLLGSVAEDVVRTSPVPVLSVRQLDGSTAS